MPNSLDLFTRQGILYHTSMFEFFDSLCYAPRWAPQNVIFLLYCRLFSLQQSGFLHWHFLQ